MTKTIDLYNFAERVERVCDFFIDKKIEVAGRDGSADLKVLEDLKNDAADIHTGKAQVATEAITGLHDYMNGV